MVTDHIFSKCLYFIFVFNLLIISKFPIFVNVARNGHCVGVRGDRKGLRSVCIVGAGAAGLCALRHFSTRPDLFAVVAFEQSGQVGGTWNYNEKTGTDENGLPVHSSMYRDLQ